MRHLTKGFGCDFPNTVGGDFELKIMKPSSVGFFH